MNRFVSNGYRYAGTSAHEPIMVCPLERTEDMKSFSVCPGGSRWEAVVMVQKARIMAEQSAAS